MYMRYIYTAVAICTLISVLNVYTSGSTNTGTFLLVADSLRGIAIIDVDTGNVSYLSIDWTSSVEAIDYDYIKNRIYFSDLNLDCIASINFDGSDGRIDKTISGSYIGGIAIDSNERLLFYTDYYLDVIVKSNLDNMSESETIVSNGLSAPRAISVIASERTVYWSDSAYDKIEKASYNGSNRQTLFDTSMYTVTTFAIDYRGGLLYWIDHSLQRIEVSNIDGTNRTTVKDVSLRYPYGIAFHKQQLWISDLSSNSIYKLNLSSGIMETVLTGLGVPRELHLLTFEYCAMISILNGRLNTTRTTYTTSVEVTCDDGYNISGAHVVQCQEDGNWSDLPTCEIVDCGGVTISNSSFNTTQTTYNTIVEVACDVGYNISGVPVVQCREDGKWSDLPTCDIVDCGGITICNSSINTTETTYNTIVEVTCDVGYNINVSQLCNVVKMGNDCGGITISNSSINTTESTFDTAVEVTCDTGYNISGVPVVQCRDDGKWSDLPTCDIVDCGAVTISNSGINTTETTYNTIVEVACNIGYNISGVPVVQCGEDGKWSDLPTCDIVDCGGITISNSSINTTQTTYNTIVEVACDVGYNISGVSAVQCRDDGKWSDLPTCDIVDCGGITISNSSINTTKTTFDTAVEVICDPGYNISGVPVVQCGDDEKWSDLPTCDIVDCGAVTISNSSINTTETTYNTIVGVACDVGYNISGVSGVQCREDGKWSNLPKCDIVDCGDITISNSSINTTETTFDTAVEVTCETGYNISGVPVVQCREDGKWQNLPTCDIVDCGGITISNSSINTTETTFDTSVEVTCDAGYNISGVPVMQCRDDGKWSDLPTCDIADCGDITISNGRINTTETTFDTAVEVACDLGFNISGVLVVQCREDGKWSDLPTCELVECGFLDVPVNGEVEFPDGTGFGSSAVFTCTDGYNLSGNKSLTCAKDGEWEGVFPSCQSKVVLGSSCAVDRECSSNSARCINGKCACTTVYDRRTDNCDTMYIFPYGDAVIDTRLAKVDDDCSDAIQFTPGIPVFGNSHTQVFVCSNGLISLGTEYKTPTPPRSTSLFGNKDIIAPFFVDSDTGNVFYRTYDVEQNYDDLNASEVQQVENMVISNSDITVFKAVFILFATWERITPFQKTFTTDKECTFQLILASNGEETFVLFIYGHDLMNWETPTQNPDVWVGYSLSTTQQYTHPYAFTARGLQMDANAFTKGISGLILKRLTDDLPKQPNYGVKCLNWYRENLNRNSSIQLVMDVIPQCPCDVLSLFFDPWWWWSQTFDGNRMCMEIWPTDTFSPYGKTCCYDLETGLWLNDIPRGGGLLHYHPSSYLREHVTFDQNPRDWCCNKTNLCYLYYDLHPVGDCYRTSWFDLGLFWGDPHFRTLDRKNFTFNGLGEYILLRIRSDDTSFDLQARTERLETSEGVLSYATVFSAFAAIEHNTGAGFHAELNEAKDDLTIYGNGEDLTNQFKGNSNNFGSNLQKLHLSKRGDALTVLFPKSGISMNITVGIEMLTLNIIVPIRSRQLTAGLLGNYDGVPDNDFVAPNGTVFPGNMTERQIFHYAKLWEVEPSQAAFVYRNGTNHTDYQDNSYVPKFLDEVESMELIENATRMCGNDPTNIACIFDFVFAGENVSSNTLTEGKSQETKTYQVEQSNPNLEGCQGIILVNLGESVTCPIRVSNESGLYFTFLNVNETSGFNVEVDTGSKNIVVEIDSDDPVDIRVIASNPANNKTSKTLTLDVLFCSLCNRHGQCINEPREDSRSTEYFRYAKCHCEPQYTGPDCEDVFDGCLSEPCSVGQTCTSLNVSKQIAINTSHICGRCPDGYETIDGKCSDIDECNETNLCDQECQNTEGSYECTCRSGYRVDTNNQHSCKDINECNEAIHNCEHFCINEDGTFICSCFHGYTLDNTTNSCTPANDTICAEANINCAGTDGCAVDNNLDPYCFCSNGFELNETETGLTCSDIDECSRNVCPQGCVNTVGTYTCSCFGGYELTDPTSCEDCKFPFWGNDCENVCNCSDSGTDQCHKARGCVCKRGWKGNTCEDDVNECQDNLDDCNDARDECINTAGSYRCGCQDGFLRSTHGRCRDVDECSTPLLNACDQTCVNVVGSYTCACRDGYILTDQAHCIDINECETGNNNCGQICTNTDGSYQCFCHFGYKLRDDRHSCRKIEDPCAEISNLTCSHYCVIYGMKAECRCTRGFELASDKQSCIDVDECTSGMHACTQGAQCHNTDGSYQCTCPVGNKLENDNRTCSPCDDYHYGQNCQQSCSCIYGHCNQEQGCICDPGWLGEDCDIDMNECRTDEDVCLESDTVCVNTPGSYICSCRPGYSNESGSCKDFDECTDAVSPVCDQECVNTDGSYYCECKHGFIYQTDRCTDIDECILGSYCDHSCDNTIGSYRCSCMPGFYLNLSDRHSCTAIGQCNANASAACEALNATCVQQSAEEAVCICSKGFANSIADGPCYDIDECANSTVCSQKCSNFDGGFRCECLEGYYLLNDDRTCDECNFGTYGLNCDSRCSCNMTNTVTCDAVTGLCTCKSGWENENCSSNINECDTSTDICPEHSTCQDTPGSYVCNCDTGYVHTADNTCTKCNPGQFGVGCSDRCQCNLKNTVTCDNINGSCNCAQGWKGVFCKDNVNECLNNPPICSEKLNSLCFDTNGSYECLCSEGYSEINQICADINECQRTANLCIQECVNTDGDFMCKCSNGYHGTWNNCSECVANTYGENCTQTCSCNVNNTLSCDKVTGNCNCKLGWNGTTCNDDVNECSDVMTCQGLQNGGCHNTAGGFSCDCMRGYTKTGDVCVLESSTGIPESPNTERVALSITLDVDIPSDTDLSLTTTFNVLAEMIKKSLLQLFNEYTDETVTIVITDIRRGSIVADYDVIYDKTVTTIRDVITDVTLDLINGRNVQYDGQNVNAKTDSFGKQSDPCQIFEAIYGQCTSGTECVVQSNGPFCRSIDNYSRNIGIIIGSCLGGLTVALIVMCLCLLRARQQQRKKDKRGKSERQKESEYSFPAPDYSVADTVYSGDSIHREQVWPTESGRSVPGLTWKSAMWNFASSYQNHSTEDNEFRIPYAIPRAEISDVRPKILGGREIEPI